ncbi:flocculation protein FLO11 [Copidosoma floridanum]|uniref:flocculation protein FLO11 n=1 Tax=Copidosoma floridanum TaxID=29053 RepID=UPI0006C9C130|nr:flocculation protein FLO11 [Copidosoma floridanum]
MSTQLTALLVVALAFGSCTAEPTIDSGAVQQQPANDYTTQTVYGFLDFTTTIGNTVMVFSPQSAPPEGSQGTSSSSVAPPIETKPTLEKKNLNIQPSKTHKGVAETKKDKTKIVVNSVVEQNIVSQVNELAPSEVGTLRSRAPELSTVVEVRPKDDVPGVKNNLAEPEYDFLSKQPTEVVDESYKVINLKPSANKLSNGGQKPRASGRQKENPTGLVTKLGGTIVKDGLTTVHETSVIGTYINGKYAQVLQSSSRVLNAPANNNVEPNNKIRPSSAQRILKTLGPQQKKLKQQQLEPTASDEPQLSPDEGLGGNRPARRQTGGPNRPKYRNKIVDEAENSADQNRPAGKNRPGNARPGYKNRSQKESSPTTTAAPESSSGGTRRRAGFRPSGNTGPIKQYKSAKSEQSPNLPSPSIKSKLPRTQGRWSYKTTPKPRIQIRKQAEDEPKQQPNNTSSEPNGVLIEKAPVVNASPQPEEPILVQRKDGEFDGELDESESEDVINVSVQQQQEQPEGATPQPTQKILPTETLNVEISTASDFNDIYFEIATIKSPYEFQVGTSRNTRYVTVTSTIKKSFATAEPSTVQPTEPLTENILANTGAAYETSLPLDSSIATLPAISLEAGQSTPPLETITETFSTTQTLLKTHLLPVIAANGNTTSRLTLVQTYNVARIVTATKTLPPAEIYQFVPSRTLNEFNSKLDEAGSELHLELDFGDDERADDDDAPKRIVAPSTDLDSDLDIFNHNKHAVNPTSRLKPTAETTTSSNVIATEPSVTPEQAQQLALLKLLGQAQPQVITTSKPVIVLETVYESHVIPLVSAGNTILSTLSRAVGTVPRTSYEYGTSTVTPLLPQLPQVPPHLFPPPPQPQFTITSAPIVQQTLATVSDSRVLKLTFGAKTAYTTLYSSRLVPTEITTYVTTTLPVQPTVPAFPGFYPAPPVAYPGYPYVG